MLEIQPRTSEEYAADKTYGPGEWKDWAELEGKHAVEEAWKRYLADHVEEIEGFKQDEVDAKREEVAKEVAREHGIDVSDTPSASEGGEPQAA